MTAFDAHDHRACIRSALCSVEAKCDACGLRLTPVRRRVLEILLERHAAMPAYDILDILRAEALGSQPPVVYRALDFLVKHGFAHRIEKLNAFVACASPDHPHDPAFLICTSCDTVLETKGRAPGLDAATGFRIERVVQEATGTCPNCLDNV